ncbi:MAG: hypothetical protein IKZ12_04075 [Alistipes sp.]|nr:hypothetical protein [Alistipes sp.]
MTIQELIRRVKAEFNYRFYNKYRFRRVVRHRLMRYYTADAPRACNEQKQVIAMFDGRKRHGGLADRLRGLATTYIFCRERGLDFRIHFVSPFRLEEYLEPNGYDWRIAPEEICYNSCDARPVYISSSNRYPERDKAFQRKMAELFFGEEYRQLHSYTNMRFEEERFGEAFHELFRPQAWLQELIDGELTKLGGAGNFLAVSTRFMESLGDFNESADRAAQALPEAEQEALLARCSEQLARIHQEHPDQPILVTSDSGRFLAYVTARHPYVCTLPGKIGHMDVAGAGEREVHTKTFLDFLVLAEAAEHFYLVGPHMYRGNFSRRAAQINNRPFHEIYF